MLKKDFGVFFVVKLLLALHLQGFAKVVRSDDMGDIMKYL